MTTDSTAQRLNTSTPQRISPSTPQRLNRSTLLAIIILVLPFQIFLFLKWLNHLCILLPEIHSTLYPHLIVTLLIPPQKFFQMLRKHLVIQTFLTVRTNSTDLSTLDTDTPPTNTLSASLTPQRLNPSTAQRPSP